MFLNKAPIKTGEWTGEAMMRKRIVTDRIISLFIAFTLILSCSFFFNETSYAADTDDIASGIWGTCEWVIDADGVLTISAGTLPSVTVDDDMEKVPWYLFAEEIREVRFDGTVHLSEHADHLFADCQEMTAFDASGLDTSSAESAAELFSGCLALSDIDPSGWETGNMTNMTAMFRDCINIESLDLSGWDMSKVTDLYYTFNGCLSLRDIDPSGWDTSSITNLAGAFAGCESIESLDLSGWDTSKVMDLSYMFDSCQSIENLDLSEWDTGNVEDMTQMFYTCGSLSTLDISGWDLSRDRGQDHILDGCESLKKLVIPESASPIVLPRTMLLQPAGTAVSECTQAGTYIGCAKIVFLSNNFNNERKEQYIPWSEEAASYPLADNTFEPENSTLSFNSWNTAPLGNGTRYEDRQLVTYDEIAAMEQYGEATLFAMWGDYGSGDDVTWDLSDSGVLTISGHGPMETYNCYDIYQIYPPWYSVRESIVEVVIEDGITVIGAHSFWDCTNITKVTIPDSVWWIADCAFYNCSSLTEVVIPDSVTRISIEAFSLCKGLTSVRLPNYLKRIEEGSFSFCSSLPSITIPDGVISINGAAFGSCTSMTSVTIPDSVTSIAKSAFINCISLPEIELPDSLTSIVTETFKGCRSLTEIDIPGSVTSIGDVAFYGCSKLQKMILPTGVETVGTSAFDACSEMGYVFIPETVTDLGDNQFIDCSSLESIYVVKDSFADSWLLSRNESRIKYVAKSGEHYFYEEIIKLPTYDEPGLKKLTCVVCGETWTEEIPKLGGNEILRIAGSNRYATAIAAADHLKEQNGISKFDSIIVASGAGFPDALSASYLAYKKNGPILLVNGGTITMVTDYINANLAQGGTVYIVGGPGAVPEAVDRKINGTVKRLAGSNRYGTNIAVLDEAGVAGEDLLIASGTGFADALSASAAKRPIFLVGTALTADQKSYLEKNAGTMSGKIYIVGGTGAVSQGIEDIVKGYGSIKRLAGSNRYSTSIAVAEALFADKLDNVVIANGKNFPDGLSGGPIAVEYEAPLILVVDGVSEHAEKYFAEENASRLVIMGGTGVISDATAGKIAGGTE